MIPTTFTAKNSQDTMACLFKKIGNNMNHNEANFEIVGVRFSSLFFLCFSFIHLYFRVLITELVIGISENTLILTI